MAYTITGNKLTRLSTLLAEQKDKLALVNRLKASYAGADVINVVDAGGTTFEYTPVFAGVARRALRIPKTIVVEFNAALIEVNEDADLTSLETLKAQLDKWVETSILKTAAGFTENDIINFKGVFGSNEKPTFLYDVFVNGKILDTIPRTARFSTERADVAELLTANNSIVDGTMVIEYQDIDDVYAAILKAVNGTTADLTKPTLLKEDIVLATENLKDGAGYTVAIANTSFDYFGQFQIKVTYNAALETGEQNEGGDENTETPVAPTPDQSVAWFHGLVADSPDVIGN